MDNLYLAHAQLVIINYTLYYFRVVKIPVSSILLINNHKILDLEFEIVYV